MDTIDLNIKNYTIIDIIQLYNIDEEIDRDDIIDAFNKLIELHPKTSGLPTNIFNFFFKAYKLLVKHYKYLLDLENKFINDEDTNNYPLIKKPNNYVLDRKIISIHSEDRDVLSWPNINEFEIELPISLKDVISIRLMDIKLPGNNYNFTNIYQNTKLEFILLPTESIPQNGGNRNVYQYATLINNNDSYLVQIPDGIYNAYQLCTELEVRMNKVVSNYLINNNLSSINNPNPKNNYNYFKLYYDDTTDKIWFGNTLDNFVLTWSIPIDYDIKCSNNNNIRPSENIWYRYNNWGMGSYLGFNKIDYIGTKTIEPIIFKSLNNHKFITPDIISISNNDPSGCSFYVTSSNNVNLNANNYIYMELDKYNSMDEIAPYSEATNNLHYNDYHGKYNSIFAKIPILIKDNANMYISNDYLNNVTFCDTPIADIKKFKVKFRYHDDSLVDFKGINISFTIEVNMLLSEIEKDYNVRLVDYYKI